jgi:hypothetical protein
MDLLERPNLRALERRSLVAAEGLGEPLGGATRVQTIPPGTPLTVIRAAATRALAPVQ